MYKIPLNKINVSSEIYLRILRSTANKYDCDIEFEYDENHKLVKFEFKGDEDMLPYIIEETEKQNVDYD